MSLPEATKAVSEKPAKNSVTAPTDRVEQKKDIDRKLRLYGVIQAFSNGRMPDNAQIDEALLYVHDHSPMDTSLLSAEGRELVQDAKNIIDTVMDTSIRCGQCGVDKYKNITSDALICQAEKRRRGYPTVLLPYHGGTLSRKNVTRSSGV